MAVLFVNVLRRGLNEHPPPHPAQSSTSNDNNVIDIDIFSKPGTCRFQSTSTFMLFPIHIRMFHFYLYDFYASRIGSVPN